MPPADHPALEARFNAFLALLDEPYGGKVLFEHYAAEAQLSFKFELTPAATLGCDTFALGLAAGALMHDEERPGQPRRPVIPHATLIQLTPAAAGRRVAWYQAREGVDGQPLYIAVGYVLAPDDAWRIGWLTLAAKPADWSYADGQVQALADFPFALNASFAAPRSWLDLAWYRLYGHPRPPLSILPEARFGCGASTACCTKGFTIDVPAGVQAFVDAIPWERHAPHLQGTRLEAIGGRRVRLKRDDEDCRFLDEQRHCRIHTIVGRSVFPVCTVYPMMFHETPDGVAVALSQACPTARANAGPPLAGQLDDLYARLALRSPMPPAAFRLERDAAPDWPAFQAAEAGLLAQLARAELPLAHRLWLGSLWLDRAGAGGDGTALDAAALDTVPGPVAEDPAGQRLALLAQLALHFRLPLPATPGLSPVALGAEVEAALANAFRNQLHSKVHAAKHGLRLAHHVNVLGYMLMRYAAARHGGATLPARLPWQIGSALMHGALGQLLETQPELLDMLSEPGFAAWLLGDPPAV